MFHLSHAEALLESPLTSRVLRLFERLPRAINYLEGFIEDTGELGKASINLGRSLNRNFEKMTKKPKALVQLQAEFERAAQSWEKFHEPFFNLAEKKLPKSVKLLKKDLDMSIELTQNLSKTLDAYFAECYQKSFRQNPKGFSELVSDYCYALLAWEPKVKDYSAGLMTSFYKSLKTKRTNFL